MIRTRSVLKELAEAFILSPIHWLWSLQEYYFPSPEKNEFTGILHPPNITQKIIRFLEPIPPHIPDPTNPFNGSCKPRDRFSRLIDRLT